MSLPSLYKLTEDFRFLERSDTEDFDEHSLEALENTLAGLAHDIQVKATNVAYFTRNLETFADTIEEAAKAMQERAARFRRKASGIRAYLLNQMQGAGITKIQAPEFTISVRKNPAAVLIAEDATIPPQFMVTPPAPPPRPDKVSLKKALEAGEVIDGVHLEASVRLDIR